MPRHKGRTIIHASQFFSVFAGKAAGHGPSPSQTTAENVLHWVECPIFERVVSKFFSGKTRPRVRKEKKKKVEN